MIFMSVGDNHTLDPIDILFNIREIGDNQIDAEHIHIRKRKSAVHDKHIVLALIKRHIFSDLI